MSGLRTDHRQRDIESQGMRVTCRCNAADQVSVVIDGFITKRLRTFRRFDSQCHQTARHAALPLPQQRVPADEIALLEGNEAIQPTFEGTVFAVQLAPQIWIGLFQPKRLDRAIADQLQLVFPAAVHKALQQMPLIGDGMIQLPAQLAFEVDAQHADVRRQPDYGDLGR